MSSRSLQRGSDRNVELLSPNESKPSMKTAQARLVTGPTLPTFTEKALLILYPTILSLGSLFSAISPGLRSISTGDAFAPSYFAHKSNIFNVYFVKVGWAWTTLAFILFVFLSPGTGPSQHPTLTRQRWQALVRLGALTLWWIAISQWFFGPAVMDRSFRLTGGTCEFSILELDSQREFANLEPLTEVACKRHGGRWRGGHDISGHAFLLVLSSAALIMEAQPLLRMNSRWRQDHVDSTGQGPTKGVNGNAQDWRPEVLILVAVVLLDLWMLLMTAIYFHTLSEKVTLTNLTSRSLSIR